MSFPRTVYRTPGPRKASDGTTYDVLIVADEVALEAAVANGWCRLRSDLGKKPDPVVTLPEPAEDAPPTRAEIEEQAKKVGVKVDGRMSDKTLLKLIDDAMKPKE